MTAGMAVSHGLAAPTVLDVREAVRRVCPSDFEDTWAAVCSRAAAVAEADREAGSIELDVVGALCAALRSFPGYLSVIGSSMAIRASCARTLTAMSEREQP